MKAELAIKIFDSSQRRGIQPLSTGQEIGVLRLRRAIGGHEYLQPRLVDRETRALDINRMAGAMQAVLAARRLPQD